jgi:hypothetical protein
MAYFYFMKIRNKLVNNQLVKILDNQKHSSHFGFKSFLAIGFPVEFVESCVFRLLAFPSSLSISIRFFFGTSKAGFIFFYNKAL